MKNEAWLGITVAFIVFMLFALVIGGLLGRYIEEQEWQKTITEKGYGGFNRVSGEWEWNEQTN